MGRVTLRDIADKVGVSVSTVSLAMRNSSRISAPVRERVLAEAQALGYRPDLVGSLLRTSAPTIIGLVCDVGQELHVEYSREIIRIASAQGWLVMMEDVAVDGPAAAVSRIAQLRAQSLIVIDPSSLGDEALGQVDLPLVCIGQDAVWPGADLVRSNNASGMRELADLLRGTERLFYLDGGESTSARRRREAFVEAMGRHGHRGVEVLRSGPTMDAGWATVTALLAQRGADGLRGAALVCYNDHCAMGAMPALWQQRLLVPDDVAVVGFDNSRIARSQVFELTSIDRQTREVASLAVARAIARAGGETGPAVTQEVDTRLVRRRTA